MLFELLMKLMLLKMLLLLRKSELRYLQSLLLAELKLHLVEQSKLHSVLLKHLVVKL